MTAFRNWTAVLGVLCLSGTVFGQVYTYPANDPYAVRQARIDAPSILAADGTVPRPGDVPVMRGPVGGAPESVAAPQPVTPNAYQQAISNSGWGSDSGAGSCSSAGDCGLPSCCENSHFFAYVGGLVMGRDMPNRFWTTFDQANPANQLRYFPGADWGGGVDTRIGYWFGCGNDCCNSCNCGPRFGIEAIYYGVWGLDGHTSIYDPSNQLGTVQDDGLVSFNGNAASNFFDNARSVRLDRNDEFHDVEINFLVAPYANMGGRFQMTALAGVRFFRFSEGLDWGQLSGAAPANAQFGDNPANEAFVHTDVQNNLIGFQIGAYMNYQVSCRFSVFAVPKIGIYGNHVEGHNEMVTGDGTVATFDNNGDALNFHNSTNVFSVLGSLDAGFTWAVTPVWSVVGGYRVVAVSGMALGDNQVPQFFADEAGWKEIKTNGNLILHGAFAGIQARF